MSLFVCVVEIECSWLMCSSCFCCQHNLSTRSQPNTHFQIDHESHIEFVKLQVVSFPFPSRCSLWSLSLLSQTLPPKRKAIFKHNLELIKQRNANQVLVRNSPLRPKAARRSCLVGRSKLMCSLAGHSQTGRIGVRRTPLSCQ